MIGVWWYKDEVRMAQFKVEHIPSKQENQTAGDRERQWKERWKR